MYDYFLRKRIIDFRTEWNKSSIWQSKITVQSRSLDLALHVELWGGMDDATYPRILRNPFPIIAFVFVGNCLHFHAVDSRPHGIVAAAKARILRIKPDLEKLYLNDVYRGKGVTKGAEI